MRLWNIEGPEVEAADAEPWDAPLASTMRPFGIRSLVRISLAGSLLYFLTAGGALALTVTDRSSIRQDVLWFSFIGIGAEELATAEHEARVELAELNHTLEDQVTSQVGEIERLGGLRRFLSPQIADAVLSGADQQITSPHRRRIAVFICDLRGFTAFTNSAEPEEVIAVLDEYYRAVGGLLQSTTPRSATTPATG